MAHRINKCATVHAHNFNNRNDAYYNYKCSHGHQVSTICLATNESQKLPHRTALYKCTMIVFDANITQGFAWA